MPTDNEQQPRAALSIPRKKKKKSKKRSYQLEDGRQVNLTKDQIELLTLCRRLAALPRELIEKTLSYLPKSDLLPLKYAKGLREVAFSLAHSSLDLGVVDEDDTAVLEHKDIVKALGRAVKHFSYGGEAIDYNLLADIARPAMLPAVRTFHLHLADDGPVIALSDGKRLVEQLGTLPFLSHLCIGDGARYEEGNTGRKAVKTAQLTDQLLNEPRASLFPSLTKLSLAQASPALLACIFSKACKLAQLERLRLRHVQGAIPLTAFPRIITSLYIAVCEGIDWRMLLQIVRLSKDTIESLYFHDKGEGSNLDYVSNPVILCPRLRTMALHNAIYCEDHRDAQRSPDDLSIDVPEWTRRAVGFMSRIQAPELSSVGLGWLLYEASEDILQDVFGALRANDVGEVLFRHAHPADEGNESESEDEEEGRHAFGDACDLAVTFCVEDAIKAFFLPPNLYDEYFSEAFNGDM